MVASREQIKTLTRSLYDMQQLRVQMGNRITQIFKLKLGQAPSTPESDLDEEKQDVLKDLRAEFKRITDGIVKNKIEFTNLIESETEYRLIEHYASLLSHEKRSFNNLEKTLQDFRIYTEYLTDVRGIGPAMAAVLISEIDIHKAKYPSSLWAYAGLDVAPDGKGRSKRKEHLVDQEYTDKDGKTQTKKSITFSPWLKTKLIGVVGSGFIKLGGPYRKIYDDYKHRLQTDPRHSEKTKGHINNMAIRYMVKMFLIDLYKAWRKIEGLEVHPTYQESKQGHVHKSAPDKQAGILSSEDYFEDLKDVV